MLYIVGGGHHHFGGTCFLYCDLEDIVIYVHGFTTQMTTVLTLNIVKT
jgi:hypothetical protein